ncbi:MAG: hypothetical protein HUK40_12760 [Desulfobacter sp.]|nr:hypothetical protein [Desulfobacter sp.]WDP83852.1 MAG: hypothetical protein HUN05_00595 [Desulfobacter sp.]
MKIAVPSTEPSLEGYLANKLGTAPYLLIIETLDMSFEVMDAPTRSSGSGASVRAVSMVMDKGAQVILVGHISPFIINGFADQGIKIVSQVSGRVDKAVKQYMETQDRPHPDSLPETPSSQDQWMSALGMGLRQFKSFLPLVTGVVLILGLFQGFIPEQRLISLFSGTIFKDSFQGACMGSLLAGNPVNSYVIGKSLLNLGVGIAGITALMLAWVNVGLIQMPAEAKALGTGFTLVRNIAEFIMAVLLSVVIAVFPGGGI